MLINKSLRQAKYLDKLRWYSPRWVMFNRGAEGFVRLDLSNAWTMAYSTIWHRKLLVNKSRLLLAPCCKGTMFARVPLHHFWRWAITDKATNNVFFCGFDEVRPRTAAKAGTWANSTTCLHGQINHITTSFHRVACRRHLPTKYRAVRRLAPSLARQAAIPCPEIWSYRAQRWWQKWCMTPNLFFVFCCDEQNKAQSVVYHTGGTFELSKGSHSNLYLLWLTGVGMRVLSLLAFCMEMWLEIILKGLKTITPVCFRINIKLFRQPQLLFNIMWCAP